MSYSPAQFRNYAGYISARIITSSPPEAAYYREFYRMLKAYQQNNGLYEYINQELAVRVKNKNLKALRNPANRVVEFYAAKLWPGHDMAKALPIVTDNGRLEDAIDLIWQWSNFAIVKQRAARMFANLGDMIWKINTKFGAPGVGATAVYLQLVDPTYVSELELDERGFVTYIRMDIPDGEDDQGREWIHTEVWDKATQQWRIWRHIQGLDLELNRLEGMPSDMGTFEESHGEDFVPFVYVPFRDDGNGRASGCYVPVLDKIDEANAKASRLAQLLFRHNRADKALVSDATDSSGRPLVPPNLDRNSDDKVEIDGEQFWKLPSGWKIEHLVAPLNYDAHLEALNNDLLELEQDLPELAYSRLAQQSDNLSGRALRYMLDGAISRALEARGNGETGIRRALQMALTVGSNFDLWDVGTFDGGDFMFNFAERSVLPPDLAEQATTAATWVNAGASLERAAIQVGVKEEQAEMLARGDVLPPNMPNGERR